jgi:hypothetical protein
MLGAMRGLRGPGAVVVLVGTPAALYLGFCGVILGGGSLSQFAEAKRYLAGAAACAVAVAIAAWRAFRRGPEP